MRFSTWLKCGVRLYAVMPFTGESKRDVKLGQSMLVKTQC